MNTQSLILLAIVTLAAIYGVYWLIKTIINTTDKSTQTILIITLAGYLGLLTLCILGGLNAMGYARLTVFNTVKQRGPRPQTPVEYVAPPVAAPLQPSSKPAMDEHKEQMEKLKRDGF